MIIIDAQLSPAVADWIRQQLGIEAAALRDLGLRDADDQTVFEFARRRGDIVMTKDFDFVGLLHRLGTPPQVIWLTCGNTSNAALRSILAKALPDALTLLAHGEPLVEIGGA